MRVNLVTVSCPIPGLEAIQASYNLAVTGAQISAAMREGKLSSYLFALPNWSEVAASLGLIDADGAPVPVPLPLNDHLDALPSDLSTWLGVGGFMDAQTLWAEQCISPKLRKTSESTSDSATKA